MSSLENGEPDGHEVAGPDAIITTKRSAKRPLLEPVLLDPPPPFGIGFRWPLTGQLLPNQLVIQGWGHRALGFRPVMPASVPMVYLIEGERMAGTWKLYVRSMHAMSSVQDGSVFKRGMRATGGSMRLTDGSAMGIRVRL